MDDKGRSDFPAKGGPESFRFLFEKYFSPLCIYAFRFTRDRSSAEEIVHETIVKLWEQREHIVITENLAGYLYKSVQNNALNYLKREQIRKKYSEAYSDLLQRAREYFSITQESGLSIMLANELESKIMEAVDSLPVQCREIFKLSRFSGLNAEYFRLRSEKAAKAFNTYFFDARRKIYTDGIGTDHASLHANFFPLAFDLPERKYQPGILEFIQSRGMACSVYGAQFLLEGVYNASGGSYGLQLLTSTEERSWAHMIYDVGSTISMEAWDNRYKPNQDWNHAWGAAPANLIPRKLMGIEPIEPGFSKFRIKPQPGTLEHAEIILPTIRGAVKVSFNNIPEQSFEMNITIPANTVAEIYLPFTNTVKQVLMNGNSVKPVKDGNFVVIGDVGSGSHVFKVLETATISIRTE